MSFPFFITNGGREILGFVEQNIFLFHRIQQLTIELDLIGQFDFVPHFGNGFSVYGNVTGSDIDIRIPTGTDTRVGDIFIEADGVGVRRLLRGRIFLYRSVATGVTLLLKITSLSSR